MIYGPMTLPPKPGYSSLPMAALTPNARTNHTAVVLNNRIYVFGGKGSDGNARNDLWSYNPATGNWETKAPLGPSPVYGQSAVSANGKMYVFGGYSGAYLLDLWKYDPATNKWEYIAVQSDLPSPRAFHTVANDDAKMWIAGGWGKGSSDVEHDLADAWEYDFAVNKWTKKSNGPAASLGASVLMTSPVPSGLHFSDKRYSMTESLPRASRGVTLVNVVDRVFMFGGQRNGQALQETWQYFPNEVPAYTLYLPVVLK